jgi:glycerol-3-phosphate dehydrogenase (NAD(P)+)
LKSFKPLSVIAPKVSVAVLGSGSWATALVKILTDSRVHVHWYVRNPQQAQIIKTTFKNPSYLTSVKFRPRKITISTDINEVVSCCDWIILAIPSVFLVSELKRINQPIDEKIIVSGIKGILPESKLIVGDHLNQYFKLPWEQFIVISGPSHAEEVALERLSYLTLSSENRVNSELLQQMMNTSYLKIKISKDVIGSEYAATLKNIYAVASGIAHGLNYGDNFQSVLISNSIREMKRFIKKVSPIKRNINETAYLGDLLVTSYSIFSRNRRFGNMIGRGYSVKNTQLEMNMIAEGYYATASIYNLSKSLGVRTPIIDAVYEVLYKQKNSKKSFNRLTKKLD